jgi:D-alanyl-D-alanine carboxypeptidase
MSINRDRRAVSGTAFLLLVLLALAPATAAAAPGSLVPGTKATLPSVSARAVSTPSAVPPLAAGAEGEAARAATPGVAVAQTASPSGTEARAVRAPTALGSRLAVPGALGATAAVAGGDGWAVGTGVPPPRVKAGSVLLADEQTGQVLFERSAEQPRAMASTTKVMTALLALEHLDQRRTVVIGTEPTTVGEESLELRRGERFTVHQLLVGLLVKSANDAAVALADAVDGTQAAFVRRMNRRAAELGLEETRYVTPYGLDRPGHHTSARDLARVWEVAMRRADFRSLVSMRSGQLPGSARERKFANTNQLLGSYPWAVGGKTGFTDDAGRCLVASASRGGRRLVAVALGSTNAFPDVRALFEYGFSAFDWVRLAQRGQGVTLAAPDGTATAYQVASDTDALVRRDLLAKLTLAPPMKLIAPGTAATTAAGGVSRSLTIWIRAAGQRVAPLRLGPPGSVSGPGASNAAPGSETGASPPGSAATAARSRFAPALVPPDSVPSAIDPFLRRGAA